MSPSTYADLIVRNARIATLDDRRSEGTALAVREGRFVDVGTDAEVLRYRGERTRVIDAGGRRIVPGLNDSHIHLIRGGLNYHLELRWDGVPIAGRRPPHAQGAGDSHAAAAVGARRWRLERVSVRRAPYANPSRDQ